MMYGGEQPQQHQPPPQQHLQNPHPPHGGDFYRGPPPPLMRPPPPLPPGQPDYAFHPAPPYDAHGDGYAAKRMRKLVHRRSVDYTSTIVRYIQTRMWQRDTRDRTLLQPTPAATIDLLPPSAYSDNPATSFATRFVHTSTNKNRCSINRVLWTPTGRRLITGSQSGEFTLWNGQSFNFEMILQAHDQAVRSMVWSHNDNWMVTGDDGGAIKYWQTNMNNVKANKSAHRESVRDLSFSSTDLKFCSCSDDATLKVWDFARFQEEKSLAGHGWDVKSVDWHPSKSLLVSGGKDNCVKLWDAKSGKELSSFHGHKNIVLSVKWNQNGNWVLTASKDQIIKLYDIRAMKELQSFRGHIKDVTALAWHPFHEEYFVSGSFDGSIFHWLVGHETPQVEWHNAHESGVWDLAWHPIGYLLCSGSNDYTTKFWCRNRPGDPSRDKYTFNNGTGEQGTTPAGRASGFPVTEAPPTPGPFAAGLSRIDGTIPGVGVAMPLSMQSLDSSDQGEKRQPLPGSAPPLAPLPPPPSMPHPSLIASGQFHQISPQVPPPQQHLQHPPHMAPLPHPPQLQSHAPPHLTMLNHPHMARPQRMHFPPLPPNAPPSSANSMPMPMSVMVSLPLQTPGSVVPSDSVFSRPSFQSPNFQHGIPMSGQSLQGPGNQAISQMAPPPHMHGMNPMHGGPVSGSSFSNPLGNYPGGMSNIQGNPNTAAAQSFSYSGSFNVQQQGQLAPLPGLNTYQSGTSNVMDMRPVGLHPPPLPNMGLRPGIPPPGQ